MAFTVASWNVEHFDGGADQRATSVANQVKHTTGSYRHRQGTAARPSNDVARDGRFLMIKRGSERAVIEAIYPMRIRIAQDWFEKPTHLAPTEGN